MWRWSTKGSGLRVALPGAGPAVGVRCGRRLGFATSFVKTPELLEFCARMTEVKIKLNGQTEDRLESFWLCNTIFKLYIFFYLKKYRENTDILFERFNFLLFLLWLLCFHLMEAKKKKVRFFTNWIRDTGISMQCWESMHKSLTAQGVTLY